MICYYLNVHFQGQRVNVSVNHQYSSDIVNQNAEALKLFYQLQTGGSVSLPYNDQGGL